MSAAALQLALAFHAPMLCLAQETPKSPILSPPPSVDASLDKHIVREPQHAAAKDPIQKPLPSEPSIIIPREKSTETRTPPRSFPWVDPPDRRSGTDDRSVVTPAPLAAPDPLLDEDPHPIPEGIPNTGERGEQEQEQTQTNNRAATATQDAGREQQTSSKISAWPELTATGPLGRFNARATVGAVVDAATEQLEAGLKTGAQVLKKAMDVLTQDVVPVTAAAVDVAKPFIKSAAQVSYHVALQLFNILAAALDKLLHLLMDIPATRRGYQQLSTWLAPIIAAVSGLVADITHDVSLSNLSAGLGAFVVVLAGGPLLNALLRGYSGDVTALKALTAVYNDGNTVLVDIRTEDDKARQGSHNLPSQLSDRWLEVEYHTGINKKTRQQLRDPDLVEAQITALEISGNKSVTKRRRILLLDATDTSRARAVARLLNSMGFNKVFVITGGFGGSKGWQQSKLPSKAWINTRKQLLRLLKYMEPVPGNGFHPPAQPRIDTNKGLPSSRDYSD